MNLSDLEKDELSALERLALEELEEDWYLELYQLIGRVRGRAEGRKLELDGILARSAPSPLPDWPPFFVSEKDPVSKMGLEEATKELSRRAQTLGAEARAGKRSLFGPEMRVPPPPKKRARRRKKK